VCVCVCVFMDVCISVCVYISECMYDFLRPIQLFVILFAA
jgi:hypothetical protein